MKKRFHMLFLGLTIPLLLALFTACNLGGGIGSGSTETALPSPTATTVPTPTPVPLGLGNTYTFVRSNQLWVALNGAAPVQATHFDLSAANLMPNIFYSQPLWFDHNHYIAFTLKVLLAGLGGGGCGFTSDYGRAGGLYILDTRTMKISTLTLPNDPATHTGTPYDGFWEFLFQEDTTHLLAWHNSGQAAGTLDGLYRYDVTSNALKLVLTTSRVPGADNMESWAPMRYNHGQLYYEAMTAVSNSTAGNIAIYKHSLANPDEASVKVLDAGNEPFCATSANGNVTSGPFVGPGFDISPDGRYLVAQTIAGSDLQHLSGQVQIVTVNTGASTLLFQQVPSRFLSQDAELTWSPDSTSVLLSEVVFQQNASPLLKLYSTSIVHATSVQEYNTSSTGSYYAHLARTLWHESSTGFALCHYQQFNSTETTNTYLFTTGQSQPQMVLNDARNFAWGANGDA